MLENEYIETINKDSHDLYKDDLSESENQSVKSEQNNKIKEGYENVDYQCLEDDENNFVECFEYDINEQKNENDSHNQNQKKEQKENIFKELVEQKCLEEFVHIKINS